MSSVTEFKISRSHVSSETGIYVFVLSELPDFNEILRGLRSEGDVELHERTRKRVLQILHNAGLKDEFPCEIAYCDGCYHIRPHDPRFDRLGMCRSCRIRTESSLDRKLRSNRRNHYVNGAEIGTEARLPKHISRQVADFILQKKAEGHKFRRRIIAVDKKGNPTYEEGEPLTIEYQLGEVTCSLTLSFDSQWGFVKKSSVDVEKALKRLLQPADCTRVLDSI